MCRIAFEARERSTRLGAKALRLLLTLLSSRRWICWSGIDPRLTWVQFRTTGASVAAALGSLLHLCALWHSCAHPCAGACATLCRTRNSCRALRVSPAWSSPRPFTQGIAEATAPPASAWGGPTPTRSLWRAPYICVREGDLGGKFSFCVASINTEPSSPPWRWLRGPRPAQPAPWRGGRFGVDRRDTKGELPAEFSLPKREDTECSK